MTVQSNVVKGTWRSLISLPTASIFIGATLAIVFSPVPSPAQSQTRREYFSDAFGDMLDYSNIEDVALVKEGPIQGVTDTPTISNGHLKLEFTKQGYFSPLWGGYDAGEEARGSEAIGHDREGNAHPLDGTKYDRFEVRMNVSAAVGAGIFFYTCTAGVKDSCQTGVQFVTTPGWQTYSAPIPRGKVTGIRVAISPESGPVDVEVDWASATGPGPGNYSDGRTIGPLPEILNPDVAGAVPYLFPGGGRPVPYVARMCANNDWATTVLRDPWDFSQKTDIEKLDNYASSSVKGGFFDGVGVTAPDGGTPGDPGIRLSLKGKTIDPSIWHRNTIIVPRWDGNYSQQFGGDGGWVYRAVWKLAGIPNFQVSLPAVEYPNDTTISIDLNDPTPFDGSPEPSTNAVDPSAPKQLGWKSPGKPVTTFRVDLSEPYRPRNTPLDEVLLSTDDCGNDCFDVVFRNNSDVPSSAELFSSSSPIGPWKSIGSTSVKSGNNIWTWDNPPKGRWWLKIAMSGQDGSYGEHVSTGPVLIGTALDKTSCKPSTGEAPAPAPTQTTKIRPTAPRTPVTKPPVTKPRTTKPRVTKPPVTKPPVTKPPAPPVTVTTRPPTTTSTTTTTTAPRLNPRVVVNPAVVIQGRVTNAFGEGFPADSIIRLAWKGSEPFLDVRTDANGRFNVPLVLVSHFRLGTSILTVVAQEPLFGEVAVPVLVQRATLQPQGLLGRTLVNR